MIFSFDFLIGFVAGIALMGFLFFVFVARAIFSEEPKTDEEDF